jgi:hypothetical protein
MVLADARDTLFTFSLLMCLIKFTNPVWTQKSLFCIGGPLMVNNVLLSISTLSSDAVFIEYANTTSLVFLSIALFSLSVNTIQWFWYFSNREEPTIKSYLCSAYVVIVVIFLFGDWIPFFIVTESEDPWSGTGYAYLTCSSYLMAGCTLCLTVISTRCANIDATRLNKFRN